MNTLCRIALLLASVVSLVSLASGCSGRSCGGGAWVCASFSSPGGGYEPWTPSFVVEAEYIEADLGHGVGLVQDDTFVASDSGSPGAMYLYWGDALADEIILELDMGVPFSSLEVGVHRFEPVIDPALAPSSTVMLTTPETYDEQPIRDVRIEVLSQSGGTTRLMLWADFTDRDGVERTVFVIMTVRET